LVVGLPFISVADEPLEEPRMGAWLDEIVAIVADHDLAVPMMEAGKVHIFADDITIPEIFQRVKAHPEMGYEKLFGVFAELTLNPAGTPEDPIFTGTGKLNPFAVPRIREAINWLIDRDYIAEEIYGGMAIPRYLPIHPAFPDNARYIDVARKLELYYAHDPAKAEEIISEEMEKLGAERIDGIWHRTAATGALCDAADGGYGVCHHAATQDIKGGVTDLDRRRSLRWEVAHLHRRLDLHSDRP
jgi:peptide/nickel transport system substrate-binding protein